MKITPLCDFLDFSKIITNDILLPNNDLLQQFEDYVIELRCEKGRKKEKKYNKK
jgi:hypothetical protein